MASNSAKWKAEHKDRVKEITRVYSRTMKCKYSILKCSAKERHIEMLLSFDDYARLVSSNRCGYCSATLPETGHGLDRKDRHVGYIESNVIPCCTLCNMAKGHLESAAFSYERILELLRELIDQRVIY